MSWDLGAIISEPVKGESARESSLGTPPDGRVLTEHLLCAGERTRDSQPCPLRTDCGEQYWVVEPSREQWRALTHCLYFILSDFNIGLASDATTIQLQAIQMEGVRALQAPWRAPCYEGFRDLKFSWGGLSQLEEVVQRAPKNVKPSATGWLGHL